MILAGSIGSAVSELAIYPQEVDGRLPVARNRFSNKNYSSLEEVVREFQKQNQELLSKEAIFWACFGVAGPVIEGEVMMPETGGKSPGWTITEQGLRERLNINNVIVLNDMPALGESIPHIPPANLIDINPGATPKNGNRAVLLATGTGVGEMLLYPNFDDFKSSPGEGGHANFAPHNELDIEFLSYFHKECSHVSCERVLSWKGLKKLYEFFRDVKRVKESPSIAKALLKEPYETVITSSMEQDILCKQTVETFVSLLGAEAGDLALRTLAVNGVYMAGGVVENPQILAELKKGTEGTFLKSFTDKEGQFAQQNKETPVKVIPDAVLIGSALRARVLAGLE